MNDPEQLGSPLAPQMLACDPQPMAAPDLVSSARAKPPLSNRIGEWIRRTHSIRDMQPSHIEASGLGRASEPSFQSDCVRAVRPDQAWSTARMSRETENQSSEPPTAPWRSDPGENRQNQNARLEADPEFEPSEERFPELPPNDSALRHAPTAAPSPNLSLGAEQSEALWNG